MGGAGPIRIGEPGSKWRLNNPEVKGPAESNMPPIVLT